MGCLQLDRLRFVQEVGRYDANLTSVLFAPLRELCVALHEVSGVAPNETGWAGYTGLEVDGTKWIQPRQASLCSGDYTKCPKCTK